jgi:hypothetical protein
MEHVRGGSQTNNNILRAYTDNIWLNEHHSERRVWLPEENQSSR